MSFSTADQAEKYYGIEKNKIDEIYGEDSIEVLYLEDRQMNSKIIYKEEGGWKCTSHSEIIKISRYQIHKIQFLQKKNL